MINGDDATTRRRVLLGIGAGTTFALAGCSGGVDPLETDSETETSEMVETDEETTTATDTESETPTSEEETTTDGNGESALVRIAQMAPDVPNVDVYVDGEVVQEDVSFGAATEYMALDSGEHTVKITMAGDESNTIFEGTVTVAPERSYTIIAAGEIDDDADQPFSSALLEDYTDDPGDDSARLRLVHAVPDAPAVDVTVASSGDVLFDGVSFGQTATTTVPAGDYTIEVRGDTEANDGEVVREFDVSLEGGGTYTALAAGYLTPDDEPMNVPFELFVVKDNDA